MELSGKHEICYISVFAQTDFHLYYSAPDPFVCSIVPRSPRTENLIRDAVHANV